MRKKRVWAKIRKKKRMKGKDKPRYEIDGCCWGDCPCYDEFCGSCQAAVCSYRDDSGVDGSGCGGGITNYLKLYINNCCMRAKSIYVPFQYVVIIHNVTLSASFSELQL